MYESEQPKSMKKLTYGMTQAARLYSSSIPSTGSGFLWNDNELQKVIKSKMAFKASFEHPECETPNDQNDNERL